jgi:hypothetical protein
MTAESTRRATRHFSADEAHLHRLLDAAESSLPAETPEGKAAILLWSVADTFASAIAGKSEFAFFDITMRLIGQAFAKLDQASARGYLEALADYSAADGPDEKEEAEQRMRTHFVLLQSTLALADTPAEGRG